MDRANAKCGESDHRGRRPSLETAFFGRKPRWHLSETSALRPFRRLCVRPAPVEGRIRRVHDKKAAIEDPGLHSELPPISSKSCAVCHVERSEAESRHPATNLACRPFGARLPFGALRCASCLRAARSTSLRAGSSALVEMITKNPESFWTRIPADGVLGPPQKLIALHPWGRGLANFCLNCLTWLHLAEIMEQKCLRPVIEPIVVA